MKEEESIQALVETRDGTVVWKRRTLMMLTVTYALVAVTALVFLAAYVSTQRLHQGSPDIPQHCTQQTTPCVYTLVESIPENLTFTAGAPSHPSTFAGIKELLGMAKESIEIASFYWTMRPADLPVQDPSNWQGEELFQDLVFAGKERGIKIRIVQSMPKKNTVVNDTIYLAKNAGADVRTLDFKRLLGAGIVHTKMWMIDRKHFYVGSANLDWRSFTQVKELGAVVKNCDCLVQDMAKIFDAYWYLATPSSTIPQMWPAEYQTLYNSTNPMSVNFNGTNYNTYLSSSPPPICPAGRDGDGDTIVRIITSAHKFVHIAVMDYSPTMQFKYPRKYWSDIDNAIRMAAFNNKADVRILCSYWEHTWQEMFVYLRSLDALNYTDRYLTLNIEVKLFVVPAFTDAQKKIPYARVNHNKYMVTEKTAYIGTSNWSGDYFVNTAGIGLIVEGNNESQSDIRQQLADVFERDWNSQYAFPLSHFNTSVS